MKLLDINKEATIAAFADYLASLEHDVEAPLRHLTEDFFAEIQGKERTFYKESPPIAMLDGLEFVYVEVTK